MLSSLFLLRLTIGELRLERAATIGVALAAVHPCPSSLPIVVSCSRPQTKKGQRT